MFNRPSYAICKMSTKLKFKYAYSLMRKGSVIEAELEEEYLYDEEYIIYLNSEKANIKSMWTTIPISIQRAAINTFNLIFEQWVRNEPFHNRMYCKLVNGKYVVDPYFITRH